MSIPVSTYIEIEGIITSLDSSYDIIASSGIGSLESTLFGTGLQLSDDYEIDFRSTLYPAAPVTTPVLSFPTNFSYFTPISEAGSATPTLLPPIEFSPVSSYRHLSPPSTDVSLAELPPTRPQSSPSTFGSSTAAWSPGLTYRRASKDLLGIDSAVQLTPASSPRPTPPQTSSASSLSESRGSLPVPRRHYAPIAPNPLGLRQLQQQQQQRQSNKRSISEELDLTSSPPAPKRKRSSPPTPNVELNDEDRFLLRLRDNGSLTWREIAQRIQTELGKSYQIPALQMRLKRLRERMKQWTDADLQALRMAHDFWLTGKFEIIAAKMAEFGATDLWTPKQCSRKWQEIGYSNEIIYSSPSLLRTPTFNAPQAPSPIEGPATGHFPLAMTTA